MPIYRTREILRDARKHQYGVGFFDALNLEMVRAYIEAAEQTRSPIIIGITELLFPIVPLEWITPIMLDAAHRAKVPVAVHLDHTYSEDVIFQALRLGYNSVMYDGSRHSHEENIQTSARLAKIAHAMDADLECEIGVVGGLEGSDGANQSMVYTEPADARDFVERTGADLLAVSVGTVHGVYRAAPQLDIPRLERIRAATPAQLVLHGGSGLSDEDFKRTIRGGITKINVYTDFLLAGKRALHKHADASYPDCLIATTHAIREAAVEKLRLFGCENRA